MTRGEFNELIKTIGWLRERKSEKVLNSIYERNEDVSQRRLEFDLIHYWFLTKQTSLDKLEYCFIHDKNPEETITRILAVRKMFSEDRVREYYGNKLKKYLKYYFKIKYEDDLLKLFENHLVSSSEFNLHLIRKGIVKKKLTNSLEDKYIRKLFTKKSKKDGMTIEAIIKWNKKLTNEEIYQLSKTYSGDELIYISQLVRRGNYEKVYRLLC